MSTGDSTSDQEKPAILIERPPKIQNTIVLYPSPGMGHIISMVELGKLIIHHYNHQFSITILLVTSDLWNIPTITNYINTISQTYPSIFFLSFPHVSVDTAPIRSRPAMAFEAIYLNKSYVLDSLQEISKGNKICAFIIDLFCGSVLSIAKDLNIPTYYFFTSGAASLAAYLYLPSIHEKYSENFKDLNDTVINFPGIPPLRAIQIPEPLLDRNDPAYNDMVFFCSQLSKCDGIIVNTFDDLEPKVISTISNGLCVLDGPTPPTYYIGHLIASNAGNEAQHDCISWLDKQPRNSVVFLCFGSRGSFSTKQLKEIATGLERSGQRFLWVVKNPPEDENRKQTEILGDFDLESILPEGFLNRVKERGMVVKTWAPQVTVLSHDSVGGFVTHCGWNSVLESVVAGVPMIAWPLYAEQHLNRNVLVEDMEMAIPVDQSDDGFVRGDELERRIRELMDSNEGKKLGERSLIMQQRSLDAWKESGSSIRALSNVVELWKKQSTC